MEDMEKEADLIRAEGLKLAWHMRGGANYDQVMLMSNKQGVA
jgi:hypothetical protein